MTNKKALATLAAQPWKISDMRNPSAEMEACALRRIPCMVYRNRQWKIDPEYVCPGITVWSKTFRDPDVTKNPDMTDQELLNSIADWMPFGALAFMPPSHIHSTVRAALRTSNFEAAKLTATKLGMMYWGVDLALTYTFPKVDYNPLP